MGKKQDKVDQYFRVHHYMMKAEAWLALSAAARAVYLQIGFRYNGSNNGKLALSVRDAAKECNIARNTASRAFEELVDLGFIELTREGSFDRKTRIASEWRMTAFRCDLTGSLTTRAFMHRVAQARDNRAPRSRPQPARRSQTTAVSVSNDGTDGLKRRPVTRPTVANDGTVGAGLGGPTVSNDGTHIIYHPQGEAKDAAQPPLGTLQPSGRQRATAKRPGVVPPTSGAGASQGADSDEVGAKRRAPT